MSDRLNITEGTCRICGCVDDDCTWCIALNDQPCFWVEPDLCSACFVEPGIADQIRARLRSYVALNKSARRRGFPPVGMSLRKHGLAMLRVCKRIEHREEKRNAK